MREIAAAKITRVKCTEDCISAFDPCCILFTTTVRADAPQHTSHEPQLIYTSVTWATIEFANYDTPTKK